MQTLSLFECRFYALGTTLKLWSELVNGWPLLTSSSVRTFKLYQESYRQLQVSYPARTQDASILLERCHQSNQSAQLVFKNLVQTVIAQLRPEAFLVEGHSLQERLFLFLKAYETFYELSYSSTPLRRTVFISSQSALEQHLSTAVSLFQGFQKAFLKALSVQGLRAQEKWIAQQLGEHFKSAKALQKQLETLKGSALNFNCLQSAPPSKPLLNSVFLSKNSSEALILVSMLVKAEYVCQSLENQRYLLASHQASVLAKLTHWSHPKLSKIIRLERILDVYQRWHHYLKASLTPTTASDFSTALQVQNCLSYQKKAFFKQAFESQTVSAMVQALEKNLQDLNLEAPSAFDKVYSELLNHKYSLQQTIARLECQLKASQSYSQAILATAALGIMQQPEYQWGQLAATLNAQLLDRFPTFPILGEPLPPLLLHRLQHAVGLAFLSVTLLTSSYIGYSYQLIATLNRILFAQTNGLIHLGNYADRLVQMTVEPLFELLKTMSPTGWVSTLGQISESCRFDEVGLLEKERGLQWLSGLGLQLGFNALHPMPAVLGYLAGTALAETAGAWVDYSTSAYGQDEQLGLALKVFLQVIAYSSAYHLASQWTLKSPAAVESLSQQEALKRLGLSQTAKFAEVHQQYRTLSFQYHPDKCRVNCEGAASKMAALNEAYNVLKKKMV